MDLDLAPVIEHYGSPLPGGPSPGGYWHPVKCINPDHDDANASASTNGLGYKCHGCSLKGDALTLIMRLEVMTFDCALRFYEELSGEQLPEVPRPTKSGRRRVSDGFGKRVDSRDDRGSSVGSRRRPRTGS